MIYHTPREHEHKPLLLFTKVYSCLVCPGAGMHTHVHLLHKSIEHDHHQPTPFQLSLGKFTAGYMQHGMHPIMHDPLLTEQHTLATYLLVSRHRNRPLVVIVLPSNLDQLQVVQNPKHQKDPLKLPCKKKNLPIQFLRLKDALTS